MSTHDNQKHWSLLGNPTEPVRIREKKGVKPLAGINP